MERPNAWKYPITSSSHKNTKDDSTMIRDSAGRDASGVKADRGGGVSLGGGAREGIGSCPGDGVRGFFDGSCSSDFDVCFNGQEQSSSSLELNFPRLNGKNYTKWAQTIRQILERKKKFGFLTGDMEKPDEGDFAYRQWKCENSLIILWLVNSMEPAIRKSFMFLSSAKEVWEAVRDTYSDIDNSYHIFFLKSKLWLAKQGNMDVTTYYNEMMKLCRELDLCYDDSWKCDEDNLLFIERHENDRVFMFLAGLNKEYDDVRRKILGKAPLPTVRETFLEIRREEEQKRIMMGKLTGVSEVGRSNFATRNFNEEKRETKKPDKHLCDHARHRCQTCWKKQGCALQASNFDQEQQSSSKQLTLTKEKLEKL
ncbi:hypothetical protein L195_g012979 [Trifolium pratense]|uniref:Uncharacterized protein n=1 Tax=Trifolium pratense TaxID=57577 RepID=A0A2K3PLW8_TRIPR|nr:hypothetical protein L195_g012979 [Trifolium pratense]